MLNNVLIIDRYRITESVSTDFGYRFVMIMDFVAINNRDGTATIIKNRFTNRSGDIPYDEMISILNGVEREL